MSDPTGDWKIPGVFTSLDAEDLERTHLLAELRCMKSKGRGRRCSRWVARVWMTTRGPVVVTRERTLSTGEVSRPNAVLLTPPEGAFQRQPLASCPSHGAGIIDDEQIRVLLAATVKAQKMLAEGYGARLPIPVRASPRRG